MKRCALALLAVAALSATCVRAESIKGLSKSKIAEKDKQNWGDGNFFAGTGADGKSSEAAADMLAIKNALARELLMLDTVMQKSRNSPESNTDPESWFKDALKMLSSPLNPVKPRGQSNLQATPAEQRRLRGLQSAHEALGVIENRLRPKVRQVLALACTDCLFGRYLKFSRANKLLDDGRINNLLKEMDKCYPKFLREVDRFAEGKTSYPKSTEELLSLQACEKCFDQALINGELANYFDVKARMLPKIDRNMRVLDRYLKEIDSGNLKRFNEAVDTSWKLCEELDAVVVSVSDWYAKNALSIDPYIREYVARYIKACNKFKHELSLFLGESRELAKHTGDDSTKIGQLRACRDLSPNKALFIKAGAVSNGTPGYTERMNALGRELKRKFYEAVNKALRRNGRPPVSFS